jgi:hypothetical protein
MEDACHGHPQVRIIVGLGVRPVFEEMRVEELIAEAGNGGNVKWPNRLRVGREDNSL